MFVPANIGAEKILIACWTFSKCQLYSNESCLSICTYTTKSKLTISTTASVERCLSKMVVL